MPATRATVGTKAPARPSIELCARDGGGGSGAMGVRSMGVDDGRGSREVNMAVPCANWGGWGVAGGGERGRRSGAPNPKGGALNRTSGRPGGDGGTGSAGGADRALISVRGVCGGVGGVVGGGVGDGTRAGLNGFLSGVGVGDDSRSAATDPGDGSARARDAGVSGSGRALPAPLPRRARGGVGRANSRSSDLKGFWLRRTLRPNLGTGTPVPAPAMVTSKASVGSDIREWGSGVARPCPVGGPNTSG